jgi:UDPglucose 6-dehydrogenase
LNVAVVGLGKLGLPLAALLAASGNKVFGFDLSSKQRELLKSRKFEFVEPRLNELLLMSQDSFEVVESIAEAVRDVEIVFVIVPTPSMPSGEFSNDFVLSALKEIGRSLTNRHARLVIDVVSTVMPGSCAGVLLEALEESSGLKVGEKLGLCYNPEFIALGSVIKDMEYPDMHLIGESSEWAGELVAKALKSITRREVPVRRMSLTEAELVKISVNNYVTMKIAYANMLYQAALTIEDVNIDTVTNAIGLDSRIGTKYLRAAAPYGGPCFPRDTRALSYFYKSLGLADSLSAATDVANRNHAEFISAYVQRESSGKTKIGICGISYKTGTQVIEESPGVTLGEILTSRGYQISYWDDEGASPLENFKSFGAENSAEDLISKNDYVVITRPLNNPTHIYGLLQKHNKPFLDLWRQV